MRNSGEINTNGQNTANTTGICSLPLNITGTTAFYSGYTSGAGTINAPPGTVVRVNISATGIPSYTQTLSVSISGASTYGGAISVTNGTTYFNFVMPASGSVNWSASFTAPNSFCNGSISVQ